MIAGDLAAYFLGLLIEYEWGSHASLIVFLALYFLSLWVSWVLAMWVTKPRVATRLRFRPQDGSTVDMKSGLRELTALSLLGAFCCGLRGLTMTRFSPLFLAAPAQ